MSRGSTVPPETLGDVLAASAVMVRCHNCGRRVTMEPGFLLERLPRHDWSTPLHEAARHMVCKGRRREGCGEKAAQILVPREAKPKRPI